MASLVPICWCTSWWSRWLKQWWGYDQSALTVDVCAPRVLLLPAAIIVVLWLQVILFIKAYLRGGKIIFRGGQAAPLAALLALKKTLFIHIQLNLFLSPLSPNTVACSCQWNRWSHSTRVYWQLPRCRRWSFIHTADTWTRATGNTQHSVGSPISPVYRVPFLLRQWSWWRIWTNTDHQSKDTRSVRWGKLNSQFIVTARMDFQIFSNLFRFQIQYSKYIALWAPPPRSL